MAKNKKQRKNKKKAIPIISSGLATAPSVTYAHGQPLDKVTYLEAKLILKPDPFTSVQSFRDFGKIVKQTAKKLGVDSLLIPTPTSGRKHAKSSSAILRISASTTTRSSCVGVSRTWTGFQ
jgi:hypothetical protein